MTRVKFTLSMPGRGSWDGKWSGEARAYFVVRTLNDEDAARVLTQTGYGYSWRDGWSASVAVAAVAKGERVGKSDGFNGYDWMIDSIIKHGRIYADHEVPEIAKETK